MAWSDEVQRTRGLNCIGSKHSGCVQMSVTNPWHLGAQRHKLLTRELGDCPRLSAATQATLMDGCQGRSADSSGWAGAGRVPVPRGLRLTLFRTSQSGRIAVARVFLSVVDGLMGSPLNCVNTPGERDVAVSLHFDEIWHHVNVLRE